MMKQLPANRFPKTFENGQLKTSGSEWWCSGFYPGTLIYLAEETGDQEHLDEAIRKLGHLEKEKWNKTTHDLGFMMFCSFGKLSKYIDTTASKSYFIAAETILK